MKKKLQFNQDLERIDSQAIEWLWKIERGATPHEQAALLDWLAENPLHSERFTHNKAYWKRVYRLSEWRPQDSLKPNPDLLAPHANFRYRKPAIFAGAATAIAALLLVVILSGRIPAGPVPADQKIVEKMIDENRRILPDGSMVKTSNGSVLDITYTDTERRIFIEKGKAFFNVAKNDDWPFIVESEGFKCVALGTAFNLNVDSANIELLVTSGRVKVEKSTKTPDRIKSNKTESSVLHANQYLNIIKEAAYVSTWAINDLNKNEVRDKLYWQHRFMTVVSESLKEIVRELNLINNVQIMISDPGLESIEISGNFYSDNVDSFIRLLNAGFNIESRRIDENEIMIYREY